MIISACSMTQCKPSVYRYHDSHHTLCHYIRYACAVEVGNTLLVTGGYYTLNTVIRYNQNGAFSIQRSLNVGRQKHACATYLNDNGDIVIQ